MNSMPRRLRRAAQGISMPPRERVLPPEAFATEGTAKKIYRTVFLKQALAAAVAVSVAALVALQGIAGKRWAPGLSDVSGQTAAPSPQTVLTADAPDFYGLGEEGELKRSETYISPALKATMEEHAGEDVLFRVVVELFIAYEDYNEYRPSAANAEQLQALLREKEEALLAYKEAEDALQGTEDGALREARAKELEEKKALMEEASRQYDECSAADMDAYCLDILNRRLDDLQSLGTSLSPIADSSEVTAAAASKGYAYFAELSQDDITSLAARGGYLFRLAPPERRKGYDPKIADYLTNLLDAAQEGEALRVAVVCSADRFNRFAEERGIPVNPEYRADGYRPWPEIPPVITEYSADGRPLTADGSPAISWQDYSAQIAAYVDEIVERNGLTDKRIVRENRADAYIDEHAFNSYQGNAEDSLHAITAGFEAALTKEEILSLVQDEEVKAVYSMDFCEEARLPPLENE